MGSNVLALPPPINPNRHVIYVYGTLRTGASQLYAINGALYDLGSFPAAQLFLPSVPSYILCERIIVDDARLKEIDAFEGYRPHNHLNSIYVRKRVFDGWIYAYNNTLQSAQRIHGEGKEYNIGDWLVWCEKNDKSGLRPLHIRGTNVVGDITTTEPLPPTYEEVLDNGLLRTFPRPVSMITPTVTANLPAVIQPTVPVTKKKRLLDLYATGAK